MSTILSSYPETSIWSAPSAPLKLHSRAREAETTCCAGVTFTKSLERIEIPQCIYDSRDGLGLLSKDPIGFGGGDANLYRYVGNSPTNATDPTGLQEGWQGPVIAPSSPGMGHAIQAQQAQQAVDSEFHNGDPSKFGGVIKFPGSVVIRNLGITKHHYWGFGAETDDYWTFKQGCVGLNKLRLNSKTEVFGLAGARAFSTLEAAMEAQQEMMQSHGSGKRIVISAYQDNYLDDDLAQFLLTGSEYELDQIRPIRGGLSGVNKKGNLGVWDFITVHQNPDLSVCFYETMDYGHSNNPSLTVKHKSSLYPPNRAGTIYIVTPIDDHPRAPLSPRGQKR